MSRKKYNAEQKAAKKELQQAQSAYKRALSEVKGVFKAFFGKNAGAQAEKAVQEQFKSIAPEISFTKAGKPTIDRKKYGDSTFVKSAANALSKSTDVIVDIANVGLYMSESIITAPEKIAKESAKLYVNRRIDALRKGFGDDSAYIDLLKEDLVDSGVSITGLGRIKGNVTVGQLWNALQAAPKLDKEVASAIQDMSADVISKDELKDRVKSAKNSPNMMSAIGSYLAATKASSSQYSHTLQALYEMNPGDAYSAAGADYQDLLDELSHPSQKLTDAELEANMIKIAQYLGGLI